MLAALGKRDASLKEVSAQQTLHLSACDLTTKREGGWPAISRRQTLWFDAGFVAKLTRDGKTTVPKLIWTMWTTKPVTTGRTRLEGTLRSDATLKNSVSRERCSMFLNCANFPQDHLRKENETEHQQETTHQLSLLRYFSCRTKLRPRQ